MAGIEELGDAALRPCGSARGSFQGESFTDGGVNGYNPRAWGRERGRRDNMPENQSIGVESPAVRAHLEIMQGVIARMAENSRSCKVWCVTLVSAILILVARTGEPRHALIALAPIVLFLVLDAYYLSLERVFRNSYNAFVGKVHRGQASASDLYAVRPSGSVVGETFWALFRFSVLPFYAVVAGTVILAWALVL